VGRSWLPAPRPEGTCLITAASAGIGAAIARELAGHGHGVTLVARREDRLRSLAARLAAECGVRTQALAADLTSEEQRSELAARVSELGLAVDVLVNNAGVGTAGRFVAADPHAELGQLRLLSEAVLDLCLRYTPAMARRRSGAVLILSSLGGVQPTPNIAAYSAAKAYSRTLGEALHA
jgi:short-subunit dehydrogenase